VKGEMNGSGASARNLPGAPERKTQESAGEEPQLPSDNIACRYTTWLGLSRYVLSTEHLQDE
jgi:hypothetical protein